MVKCGKCSAELKSGELVAKCVDCGTELHPACTQIGLQNFTKTKSKNWKCESCVVESSSTGSQRSTESSATAVDKKTLLEALNAFKSDLKSHTDAAVGNVIKKIDTLKEEVQLLSNRFNTLEQNQTELRGRCEVLDQANVKLTEEVRSLRERMQEAEQYSRCANVEILGLPESQGENIYAMLQKFSTVLGIDFRREDVSIAHRLRLYSAKHTHPPIICQFVSRAVKEQWMAAAKKKRNINSKDIYPSFQPSDVYVNHHLTAHNKSLLGRARRLQREGKVHFAGYINGRVLVKQQEKDAASRISRQEDLDKFDH